MLAGGASRRMAGAPKVLVEVGGIAMGRRVADSLLGGGARTVVVVGGDPAWAEALGLDHLADRWPGLGPLGGLATALADATAASPSARVDPSEVVVVAACDQPWLDPLTIVRLADSLRADPGADAAAGVDPAGRHQPLPCVWRRGAGSRLVELVHAGHRRLDAAFDPRSTVRVPVDASAIADVDEPADLRGLGAVTRVDGLRRSSP